MVLLQQGQPVDPSGSLEPVPVSRTPDGGVHPAPAQAGLPATRRCGQSVPQVGLLRQTRFLSPPHLLGGGQAGSGGDEEVEVLVGGVGEDNCGN